MICYKCNSEVPEGSLFCNRCGSLLEAKIEEELKETAKAVSAGLVGSDSVSSNNRDLANLDNKVAPKKNSKHGMTFIVVLIIVAVLSVFMYVSNQLSANKYKSDIENAFNAKKWDEVVNLINNYEKVYVVDDKIRNMLSLASINIIAESQYKEAYELYQNKNYRLAYNTFSNIDEKSSVYNEAKEKLEEIAQILLSENLTEAKKAFELKDFVSGYQYLDNALNVEPRNEEVLSLKQKYSKQYNAQLERKRLAAEATAKKIAEEQKKKAKSEGVRIGMTQQEVLDSSWGKPIDVNRTITAYGTHEQWVYSGYNYLYFENGILTSIQN